MAVDTRGNDTLIEGNRAGDPRHTSNPPRATIAVLDDDELYRENLGRVLRNEGYAVIEAGDLSSLEGLLSSHPVDLIVADSRLPDGDGWARAQELAQQDGVKVLAVSGYDAEAIEGTGGEVLPMYWMKDTGRFTLLKAVEEALARA